ncbi:MAG: pyridoxal phosphate-dependent decarboxylase family protein, partial [Acetobacteraceae bacterium]
MPESFDRSPPVRTEPDLDPEDWETFRTAAHAALDLAFDYMAGSRSRPVWQPTPETARAALATGLPAAGMPLDTVVRAFEEHVMPYATGNLHPRFMGWVHGGGNPAGLVGEMLAAGLNANLGGRDHAPIAVERQVVGWMAEAFGLPPSTAGLLVTGTSIANLIAVLVARAVHAGVSVLHDGVAGHRLTAYTSVAAHGCIPRAMDMAGLGTAALRMIGTDPDGRIETAALADAIARDRA